MSYQSITTVDTASGNSPQSFSSCSILRPMAMTEPKCSWPHYRIGALGTNVIRPMDIERSLDRWAAPRS
jgi:hypothetical protein